TIIDFLNRFNDENAGRYRLTAKIFSTTEAAESLRREMSSENPPDIVGPVGIALLSQFPGGWLDLTDRIEKTDYDLTDFDPALVDMYRFGSEGLISLPFALFPSALWYNKPLFDDAGIAYPPHDWETEYQGKDWDYSALRDIARKLTLDQQGRSAAQSGFDPEAVSQFGFSTHWTTLRGQWSYFGAGTFTDERGKAVIPEVWRNAARWYYDGIWKDRFIPSMPEIFSEELGNGNPFASGNLAMMPQNLWYTCCVGSADWDAAAIPSFEGGRPVAKYHADSFAISKNSKNPQGAFDVISLFLGRYALELRKAFGYDLCSFPGRISLQPDSIALLRSRFPGVDFQVFLEGLNYLDQPNHESGLPNFMAAEAVYEGFRNRYESEGNLNLDAELDALRLDLQAVFDQE
ncbi:MAG: extracellular solute-binding protein, partial [Anaerolineales bacterium]